jgi:dTDP-4-dehydrorhamnose reductase
LRLLVTGATGHLGGEVVARAVEAGWEVCGTSRTDPAFERLDVRDGPAVAALVRRFRPAAAVHTAYLQDGPDAFAVTATGAGHVASACADAGVRLVHLSTDVVFDGRACRPYGEVDAPSPVTDYGRAKAEAERLVAAADPGAAIVRTSLLYGGRGGRHEALILAVARGERRLGFFVDELRCPVHVADLARALLELAGRPYAGPIHLGGADAVSRFQFARLVADAHGYAGVELEGERSAGRRDPRPLDCRLDSSRAAELLATRLRGVREVLGRAADTAGGRTVTPP